MSSRVSQHSTVLQLLPSIVRSSIHDSATLLIIDTHNSPDCYLCRMCQCQHSYHHHHHHPPTPYTHTHTHAHAHAHNTHTHTHTRTHTHTHAHTHARTHARTHALDVTNRQHVVENFRPHATTAAVHRTQSAPVHRLGALLQHDGRQVAARVCAADVGVREAEALIVC
jgi:hypothetical protein